MTEKDAGTAKRPKPSAWVQTLRALTNFSGTIGPLKDMFTFRQCINLHKLLVMPVYLAMIVLLSPNGIDGDRAFSERSYATAAILLFFCHGLYGILWVLKDIYYPDPSFQVPMSPLGFLTIFSWPLAMYYLPMFCLVTDGDCPGELGKGDPFLLAGSLACYIVGIFYHFGSDIHKSIQLQHERPRALITTGLFRHCRNPNYFGELLIYIAYTLFSGHAPFLLGCFSTCWLLIFLPNMLTKEASMSRYPEWDDYVSQSGFVIPWLPSFFSDLWKESLSRYPSSHSKHMEA